MNEHDDAMTALWWHLFDEHDFDATKTHGDPELMHAAAHAFGIDHRHTHQWSDGGDR